jgi:hypothetical protein
MVQCFIDIENVEKFASKTYNNGQLCVIYPDNEVCPCSKYVDNVQLIKLMLHCDQTKIDIEHAIVEATKNVSEMKDLLKLSSSKGRGRIKEIILSYQQDVEKLKENKENYARLCEASY